MFFYEAIPWYSWVMCITFIVGFILLNQLVRLSKKAALGIFLVLPAILTFVLWPKSAGPETSVGTWFAWAKVYSALAGCLGFLALRYSEKLRSYKLAYIFPPLILSINILEAVIREFQLFTANGFQDGMLIIGGPWNILNGIAGIISIITLSGWFTIFISKDKHKDMIWPDQLWFWVIAYDLWNFAYVYNCVPDHSFYDGFALLLSCTIPAFFIKKGAWLEFRAHTLGFWMIFAMSYPSFMDHSMFAVQSSHNVTALWIVAGISFVFNVGVLIYHYKRIFTKKINPFKNPVYEDHPGYIDVVEHNMYPNGRTTNEEAHA